MLVNKISLTATEFDGISKLNKSEQDVSIEEIINKKINTSTSVNVATSARPSFIYTTTDNVLNLGYEVYDRYGEIFVLKEGFKFNQPYLNHVIEVLSKKWDEVCIKIVINSRILGFHEIAKIVKEKTDIILKSWEEVEKYEKLRELLEFNHVKDNINVLRMLFPYVLSGSQNKICLVDEKHINNFFDKDGLPTFSGSANFINKFSLSFCGNNYNCDYDGNIVTMYPDIHNLMDERKITKFLKISQQIGSSDLIIKTQLKNIPDCRININYNNGYFTRNKSTANLTIDGINNEYLSVNFNLTAEYIKSILEKFDKKKTGLKKDIMERFGELCEEIVEMNKKTLSEYFNTNMIIKTTERSYGPMPTCNIKIDKIDDSIINYVIYVYIKQRMHGSALFLKNKKNELYSAVGDFSTRQNLCSIQYMRLNEGIT